MKLTHAVTSIIILGVATILIVSCRPSTPTPDIVEIEKTIVVTQEVEVEGEVIFKEVVVTPTSKPEEPEGPRTLVICMGTEPETLYVLSTFYAATGVVVNAIYDGPIDGRSFSYQPIILEKLPSLADGDAIIETVVVATGDRVVDDSDQVVELTQGIMVRPSGCNAPDCSVEYKGGVLEMDRLVVTFKMLPGLLWSDGTPLTTADSLYAFDLIADPDTPVGKYGNERTASYEALDEFTLTWTGLPGFMDSTYFLNFWTPFPEHVWGEYTAEELIEAEVSSISPLGWGPYMIDEWVKGQYISLSKNPNYFRANEGLPKFERLIYRFVGEYSSPNIAAILSGDCDIVLSQLDDQSEMLLELKDIGRVNVVFMPSTVWEHSDFNIAPLEGTGFAGWDTDGDGLGPFGDVRLRRAIAMCMDREAVVETVLFGQSMVIDAYLPPNHPLFNPDVMHYDYDPEAAGDLLDEIGWRDEDGDGVREAHAVHGIPEGTPLEFYYETTTTPQRQQATQILADSMLACGIQANLKYYSTTEWFDSGPEGILFGRRFDLGQFAWVTGVQPPCGLYDSRNIPGPGDEINPVTGSNYEFGWAGQNETGYFNSEYDAVCRAAYQSLPGQPGYEQYHLKAQEIFARDLPVVPLYLRLTMAVSRPDICNFILDPTAGNIWNIEAFDYGPECQE